MSAMASARIQRWAITLAAYDYKIVYKTGSKHANADMLSRLPLPQTPSEISIIGEWICSNQCQSLHNRLSSGLTEIQ